MCRPHTRFVHWAATPDGERKGVGPERRVGNSASSRPWRAGIRLGGAPRWRFTPSLISVLRGFLGGDSTRQVGDSPWLEESP
ncbi:hypothetical protein I79_003916 [Cricetulus griseus]|uniref:Uncharacterized protein n=1 Tax=Cricetulus griseus TaxID=10029 RepID=G3H192_CRIGR|nr:hypothetical protein I79_003916 [Cricetulus griseus]